MKTLSYKTLAWYKEIQCIVLILPLWYLGMPPQGQEISGDLGMQYYKDKFGGEKRPQQGIRTWNAEQPFSPGELSSVA